MSIHWCWQPWVYPAPKHLGGVNFVARNVPWVLRRRRQQATRWRNGERKTRTFASHGEHTILAAWWLYFVMQSGDVKARRMRSLTCRELAITWVWNKHSPTSPKHPKLKWVREIHFMQDFPHILSKNVQESWFPSTSIDWFKVQITRKSHLSWENLAGFRLRFSLKSTHCFQGYSNFQVKKTWEKPSPLPIDSSHFPILRHFKIQGSQNLDRSRSERQPRDRLPSQQLQPGRRSGQRLRGGSVEGDVGLGGRSAS